MLFSKREYLLTTKPVDEQIMTIIQKFLTDNECVLSIFDGSEVFAFFTNKKIIFVCRRTGSIYETELLPYQSISRCIVLGSQDAGYGKLELVISDEIIISFCLPKYMDAVKLYRQIWH